MHSQTHMNKKVCVSAHVLTSLGEVYMYICTTYMVGLLDTYIFKTILTMFLI